MDGLPSFGQTKGLSRVFPNITVQKHQLFGAQLSSQSLEKEMATHPVFMPGELYGQRSLVGCSPWGHKKSDMTVLLHFLSFIWKHNARKGVMYIHTYKFYIYTYYLYKYIHVFMCLCVLVTQSCLTFCDPMDCSPPGSSVHSILQAGILEWVAISFSLFTP